ncbi:choice-of-anchor Q domain-containing protein [Bythopirellula goksoeyrii]|uniref:choice-of-anchor Q domain-containing protein n=1 Tax=Bythopirellula goksoeyrii TaxID=1400387 RepID=UPI0011CE6D92|nr:choice-of-anchor Q domain-containing protein [Bythopirellula goksoeyrii]
MSRQDRFNWFASRQRRRKSSRCSQPRIVSPASLSSYGRRLHVETLEDRRMLAVITVTSLADNLFIDDEVTLREAILAANTNTSIDGSTAGSGADTIEFAAALSGETITLGGLELEITEALTIDATALAANVTIDANTQSRVLNFTASTGDLTLSGLTITGGQTTGIINRGGGIRFDSSDTLTLNSSTVSGNDSGGDGGGIFTQSGAVTLTGSTVSGNDSVNGGGGIFTQYGAVTLTGSTVSGNESGGGGGGIRTYSGAVTLTDSTVSGNSTKFGDDGGGIRTITGAITLTSSTVSGNSTDSRGGGIDTTGGAVTLISSTVTANSAGGAGGGVFVFDSAVNPPLIIVNSIVAGNTDNGTAADLRPDLGGALNVDYSLIGDTIGSGITAGTGSGNLLNQLALLGPLADYGGPTLTHGLLADSPAIDAADPTFDILAIPNDQRGAPFLRGVGTRVDIGAYESQPFPFFPLVVDTILDLNDSDFSAGNFSLRKAIGLANGNLGADTIQFDPVVFATPQTMLLNFDEMRITDSLTITGPGQDLLTLDAGDGIDNIFNTGDGFRIFNIDASGSQIDVTLSGLTLTGGDTANGFLGIPGFSGQNGQNGRNGQNGGAIRSLENLTLIDLSISGNATGNGGQAGNGGDAIFGAGGNGGDGGAGGSGGGIYSTNGTLTIVGSTINGNSTGSGGNGGLGGSGTGGPFGPDGANGVDGDGGSGGGIYALGTLTITSSTVSGNSSDSHGGGIGTSSGVVKLSSSTVTANSAGDAGGGVFVFDSAVNPPLIIVNSIVAGNTDNGTAADLRPDLGGALNVDYSLIGDTIGSGITAGTGSGNLLNQLALLGPLADNGGPTLTHGLLAGSPAIDAGDPGFTSPPDFDQRGAPFVRVVDGGEGGLRIDMGAVELQTVVDSADFDNDGDIDGFDFLTWQRGFGTPSASSTDGDADNDGDVDAVDLGFWESQFGLPAPAVALSSLPAGEQANEEPLLASVAVAAPAPLRSASQQAVVNIEVVPVALASKPLVTFATPASVELASVAQIASGFSTTILRANGFKFHLNTAQEYLPETNGFAEYVDLAFERAWDDFDSLAHEQRDLIQIIANRDKGGHLKSHAQAADDLFAALTEEKEFAGLQLPL